MESEKRGGATGILLVACEEEAGIGETRTRISSAEEVAEGVGLDIPTDSLMARRLKGALVFLRWPVTKPGSARICFPRPAAGGAEGVDSAPVEGGGRVGATGGTGSAVARGRGPMSTPLSTPGGLTRFYQSRSPMIPTIKHQINEYESREKQTTT